MKKLSVVILAAGEGTRMKSERPKVLHALFGKPLVEWVLGAIAALRPENITLIVGHKGEQVREALAGKKISFIEQKRQLGSGHALLQAEKKLKNYRGDLLVLCADTPLIAAETLTSLVAAHRKGKNAATVLSAHFTDPFGYGRIVRRPSGDVEAIVEEKDATPEQRSITEINSGIYCFQSPLVWKALHGITADNAKKEYYLTDALSILNRRGAKVGAYSGVCPEEIMGINTRLQLAEAEKIVRERTCRRWMHEGVTIIDPAATYISPEATIGADTVLYPGTLIEGRCRIGGNCVIGPWSCIKDSTVGDGAEIRASFIAEAAVGDRVRVGPFAHLRPGAVLKSGSRVGNFSEVKKSVIGEGSKVNHLSYIGDATLGRGVNIGAGTITCNYDGIRKHPTVIGDRVFVGSNVNLVAPVTIGADALLGAGSTITDDVPPKTLALARSRQVNKKRKK